MRNKSDFSTPCRLSYETFNTSVLICLSLFWSVVSQLTYITMHFNDFVFVLSFQILWTEVTPSGLHGQNVWHHVEVAPRRSPGNAPAPHQPLVDLTADILVQRLSPVNVTAPLVQVRTSTRLSCAPFLFHNEGTIKLIKVTDPSFVFQRYSI